MVWAIGGNGRPVGDGLASSQQPAWDATGERLACAIPGNGLRSRYDREQQTQVVRKAIEPQKLPDPGFVVCTKSLIFLKSVGNPINSSKRLNAVSYRIELSGESMRKCLQRGHDRPACRLVQQHARGRQGRPLRRCRGGHRPCFIARDKFDALPDLGHSPHLGAGGGDIHHGSLLNCEFENATR